MMSRVIHTEYYTIYTYTPIFVYVYSICIHIYYIYIYKPYIYKIYNTIFYFIQIKYIIYINIYIFKYILK